MKKTIIIAGPCAVESQEQVTESIKQAKAFGVDFIRLSLWKPRTKPGFEGFGEDGIKFLVQAAQAGLNPGVEPLIPEQTKKVVDAVLPHLGKQKLMIWIGARNQNHYIQREMARIAAQDKRIMLMVKNQIWPDEKHWEGIAEHVLAGGIEKENLMLCHRGFIPYGDNPNGYRNIPDWEMAMRIKQKTGLPMIFDPSHTGGSVDNVFKITHEANQHEFDGYIIEVHPHPENAITDAKQQITWTQLRELTSALA
jgi:chorismate mutase